MAAGRALSAPERLSEGTEAHDATREAWGAWLDGGRAGTIRNRSGDPYKRSAIRGYEKAMEGRVLPKLGGARLSDLTRADLQEFANGLLAEGLSAPYIHQHLLPVRAIYRRAISLGEIAVNTCAGLDLPAVRSRRERFASPAEALITAVPVRDRALWATAFYAGLRLGELRALRVEDVDLATGVIHVRRGWDEREGEIELKSNAGRRKVPLVEALRDYLLDHLARTGRTGSDLILGSTGADPFAPRSVQYRADKAWRAAKLERITPHGLRHSYAALMIAAGVNAKALSVFMGHANISITLDTYGHLMPGSEAEAAELVEVYLAAERERSEDQARAAVATPSILD